MKMEKAPANDQPMIKMKAFHLVVEGRGLSEYWLHLQVPIKARLEDLDYFLRQTWLECCGHMSMFHIENRQYSSAPLEEEEALDMHLPLSKVLQPKTKFHYEYDFGTTTELALKVIAELDIQTPQTSIEILAQNDPPTIPCGICKKPATEICSCCSHSPEGWLCSSCIKQHECGEDMFLPIVNSPRTGQCAYSG